jgi:uncharacterized protein (TIGR02118 family)
VVQAIYVLYRKEGLSREEFARHWVDVHRPIARRLPRLRSYTLHPVTSVLDVEGTEADGFAICVYDSMEDFEAAAASPEMAEAGEDAAKMARRFDVYLVEEHTVI